jgi:CubicO group peptidase (beta-lactamase class C family)
MTSIRLKHFASIIVVLFILPLTKYLPWFQMYDPWVTREMMVRDLLCHRSGLATFGGDLRFCDVYA